MKSLIEFLNKLGLSGFIARQLSNPKGYFGSRFITGMMNKSNAELEYFALELLKPQANDYILEIGFGNGRIMEEMCKKVSTGKITGIDISEDAIAQTTKRLKQEVKADKVILHKASVEQIPLESVSVDKVFTCNTIYFWPDLDACAKEVARTLKPGGLFICGFRTTEEMLNFDFVTENRHIFKNALTEQEVIDLLLRAGFGSAQVKLQKSEFVDSHVAVATK